MKPSEHLRAAKALIANKENWTQRALARNTLGDIVAFDDPTACKFCVVGALYKVGTEDFETLCKARRYLFQNISVMLISAYNDTTNHRNVLRLFNRAIKLTEEVGE